MKKGTGSHFGFGKNKPFEDDYFEDEEYYSEEEEDYEEDAYYEDDSEYAEDDYYGEEEEYFEDEVDEETSYEDGAYAEDGEVFYEEEVEEYGDPYDAVEFDEDSDDDYYEDDDEGYRRSYARKSTKKGGFGAWFASVPLADKALAGFGIIVLLVVCIVGSVLLGSKKEDQALGAFTNVGSSLDGISVIGESGLLAVADTQAARATELLESGSQEEANREVTVVLKMTTIVKDLKIKFVNSETDKLVPNVPFKVEVTTPKGSVETWEDEDKDGVIYREEIDGGNYSVRMLPLEGDLYAKYTVSTAPLQVDVKKAIEYKKVEIKEEIKSEAEVNAALEDTAKDETEEESKLVDTVPFVKSTKTTGEKTYTKIDKSTITDPSLLALRSLRTFYLMAAVPETPDPGTPDPGTPDPETPVDPPTTVSVTGVSLSSPSLIMAVGGSETLTATVSPSDATTKTVTWSSSDDTVASVSSGGAVTANKAGTCTITVTTTDGSKTATCSVTVKEATKAVESVALNKATLNLKVGGSETLTATVSPTDATDKSVIWKSSESTVASVSGGEVTAKKAGTCTITVTTTDGSKTATCSVTVEDKAVESVALSKTSLALAKKGDTETLTVTVTPSDAKTKDVLWSSSDNRVATVDTTGKVTAVGEGKCTITVKSVDGGKTATCEVSVGKSSVAFSVATLTLEKGKTGEVTITTNPDNETVLLTVADTKIATIAANGKKVTVTAVAGGETTLTAKLKSDESIVATCKIVVTDGMTFSPATVTVAPGKSTAVVVTTSPSTATISGVDIVDKTVCSAKLENKTITVTGIKMGTTKIIVVDSNNRKAEFTVTVASSAASDTTSKLKDKDGEQVYVSENGKYREAVYADYFKFNDFYLMSEEVLYTGWQQINGKTYYYLENHKKVTGEQVIQGAKYNFGSDGALQTGAGSFGIDVSKWNGSVDWNTVAKNGVNYAIIRCGYRGSSSGALITDPKFTANISGANAAGIKTGVYFFTQAVNEKEAVEEASMVIELISKYKINYPVYIDVESSGGRADSIDKATRTAVIKAFCQTIQNAGYTAGVYANKTWLTSKIDTGSLGAYKIWLAQYASTPTYGGRYNMWQYSDKGSVPGISGTVDLNLSYLGY